MKITKKAERLYKYFDYKEFDNGTKKVVCIADPSSKAWDDCMSLIHEVSDNTNLSMDSYYAFTMEALGIIADSNEDDIEDSIVSIEADIYTSDLTTWLNESNNHVYYLTEALTEFEPQDGFALLTIAQERAKEEVFYIVLEHLRGSNKQLQA